MSELGELLAGVVKDLPESLLNDLVTDLAAAKTSIMVSQAIGDLPSKTQRSFGKILSLADQRSIHTVSYTHLTLPTILLV